MQGGPFKCAGAKSGYEVLKLYGQPWAEYGHGTSAMPQSSMASDESNSVLLLCKGR